MPSVRQEPWAVVIGSGVRRVQGGELHRLSAGRGNAMQDAVYPGEDDDAVAVPRAAAAQHDVANNLRRTARHLDLLQMVFRKEADEAAVGRPERIIPAFGSSQRPGGPRIQPLHPKEALAPLCGGE